MYTYPGLANRTFGNRPGPEYLPTPGLVEPSSRAVDRPQGSAEELEKVFQKTPFGLLLLTWIRSLALV
jgi:hypothetical protein